jgi:hypothetical protein
MLKICKTCKIEKDISFFGTVKRNNKITYKIYCKDCLKLVSKNYRATHKIKQYKKKQHPSSDYYKRKEYYKQRYLNNLEKIKEYCKTSEFKERKRKYKKNRRKTDIIFKIRGNISRAISKALQIGKSSKSGKSILQFLNYTINDLKVHLENQFIDNMSWSNYGTNWHIDHIIPQSDLPYISMEDNNFKICWSLDNLRPLDAKQNIVDGARRTRHKLTKYMDNNI